MKMPMRIVSWGPQDWDITNFIGMDSLWGHFFRFVRPAGRTTSHPTSRLAHLLRLIWQSQR